VADETIAVAYQTPAEVRAAEPLGDTKKTRAPRKKGEPKPATPASKASKAASKPVKAAKAATKTAPAAAKAKTTAGASDDLKALITLEAENLKLRNELAAKLRAENEELRRRLGQA
jgi:putative transposase